jgi:hypothetical protein
MIIETTRPTLEPHTQEFVDGLAGAPPIYSLSPDEARSVLMRAQSYTTREGVYEDLDDSHLARQARRHGP